MKQWKSIAGVISLAVSSGMCTAGTPDEHLAIWLRADRGLVANERGQVVRWANQGTFGSVFDMAPFSGTPNDGIMAVTDGTFNGWPSVSFNMTKGGYLISAKSSDAGLTATGGTWFVVYNTRTSASSCMFSLSTDHSHRIGAWFDGDAIDARGVWGRDSGTYGGAYAPMVGDSLCLSESTYMKGEAGRVERLFVKSWLGSETRGTPGAFAPTAAPLMVGDFMDWECPMDGQIAELRLYNRPLTAPEREAVDFELSAKYGLKYKGFGSGDVPPPAAYVHDVVGAGRATDRGPETATVMGAESGGAVFAFTSEPAAEDEALVVLAHDGGEGLARRWYLAGEDSARTCPATLAFDVPAGTASPVLRRRLGPNDAWKTLTHDHKVVDGRAVFQLPAGWSTGEYKCESRSSGGLCMLVKSAGQGQVEDPEASVCGIPIVAWEGSYAVGEDDDGVVLDWSDRPTGATTVCVQYEGGALAPGRLRGLVAFKGSFVDGAKAFEGWHPAVAVDAGGLVRGLWTEGVWADAGQMNGLFASDSDDGFFAVRYDPAGSGTTVFCRTGGDWRPAYVGAGLKACVMANATRACGVLGACVGGGVAPGASPAAGLRLRRVEAFPSALGLGQLEAWAGPSGAAKAGVRDPDGPRRVLELPPGPGNPRNSEGGFVTLRDGRVLMVYSRYNGKGGGDDDPSVLSRRESRDGGRTWSAESVDIVRNEGGGSNVMSVSLLRLASGEIALFYLRKTRSAGCFPVVRFSRDEAETWSEPVKCLDEADSGFCVLNNDRAVQLPCGRILLPIARHCATPGGPDMMGQIFCLYSDDSGRTWRKTEPEFRAYEPDGSRIRLQEPGVVALKDGRVMMWIRTDGGRELACYSSDRGETWTEPVKTDIHCPCAPVSIKRLRNGDLLMAWNDHRGHPELKPLHVYHAGTRSPLVLAVSKDDGRTWQKRKVLEGNVYDGGWYCYTAIHEEGDAVLLEYCCMQHLCHSRITRVPLKWLYGPDPDGGPTTIRGYFND